jgi:hypoxanthine phosphoribosyltransferase
MVEKEFIRADDLVRDSFQLAKRIYDSGFIPDVLLVLWRGGTPVGIVIHEFLLYKGVETYHAALKAVSYTGIGERSEPVLENICSITENLNSESRVLVIDDIFDSGSTMKKVVDELGPLVKELKIATLYYKSEANTTDIVPDFYGRKTDRWIVFPHELMGLSPAEIRAKDHVISDLIEGSPS